MTITKKIKTIDNKIKENKAQYDLDRQKATISDLSSENVGKYEKDLLEKVTTIKQIDIAKKAVPKIKQSFYF